MSKSRTVVDSIGIMHDRDGLSIEELRIFVKNTEGLSGVIERNDSQSDHEYVTFDFVIYEDE